jgi:hypothetical protein
MRLASKLPHAIFAPATKAATGHDENISFDWLARDTEALVASWPVLSEFLRDAWRAPAHFRRAEYTRRVLAAQRARLMTTVQQQASSLIETVTRPLNRASREAVGELQHRIGVLEQRLDRLGMVQNVAAREEDRCPGGNHEA